VNAVRSLLDTIWVTQTSVVELFQSSKANISVHLSHIFAEGELDEDSVVRNFRTTAADGKAYRQKYFLTLTSMLNKLCPHRGHN
jgi:hypothetical protein